jgi:sulfite reductase (NADPH) hemoprotein beta-component
VSRADVVAIIDRILSTFVHHRQEDETFLGCFQRIGIEPFKERIYGTAQ